MDICNGGTLITIQLAIKPREREDAQVLQVRRLRKGEQAERLCSNHDTILNNLEYFG
jgi:hypothetical protein